MRVLFVAHDVRPTSPAEPRIRAWIEGAVASGWDATLVTARDVGPWTSRVRLVRIVDPVLELYLFRQRRRAGKEAGKEAASPSAVDAPPPPPPPSPSAGWGRRLQDALLFPDPEAAWSRRVRRWARREPGWDWVVTAARPESVGLVGEALQDRGARWWFDFADGWTERGLRDAAMRPGRRREREQRLEARWVARADEVSTVDSVLAAHLQSSRSLPVRLYPNGVPVEYSGVAAGPAPAGDRLRLVYIGRIRGSDTGRSLERFVEAVRGTPLEVDFYGEYDDADRQELARLRSAGCVVHVSEPVPRAELAARRGGWHGAIVLGSPGQVGSTSKLFDALGLRLPVFAMVPDASRAAALVRELGIGEVAPIESDPAGDRVAWGRFQGSLRPSRDGICASSKDYSLAALVLSQLRAMRTHGLMDGKGDCGNLD